MRVKRYVLITALLAAYGIFMTLYFGLDLLREGHALRFWLTLGGEVVLLIMTYFALRYKEILREQNRKQQEKDISESGN